MAPILATVIIVASTIVISVAMGGFIYGTLGTSANSALVDAQSVQIPADIDTGFAFLLCAPNQGNFFGGYVALYNSGTVATHVNALTFTYAGSTQTMVPQGTCVIPPDTSLYVLVVALPLMFQPVTGNPYSGYVSAANGAEILFDGSFL